jgi:hypothetical protein
VLDQPVLFRHNANRHLLVGPDDQISGAVYRLSLTPLKGQRLKLGMTWRMSVGRPSQVSVSSLRHRVVCVIGSSASSPSSTLQSRLRRVSIGPDLLVGRWRPTVDGEVAGQAAYHCFLVQRLRVEPARPRPSEHRPQAVDPLRIIHLRPERAAHPHQMNGAVELWLELARVRAGEGRQAFTGAPRSARSSTLDGLGRRSGEQ